LERFGNWMGKVGRGLGYEFYKFQVFWIERYFSGQMLIPLSLRPKRSETNYANVLDLVFSSNFFYGLFECLFYLLVKILIINLNSNFMKTVRIISILTLISLCINSYAQELIPKKDEVTNKFGFVDNLGNVIIGYQFDYAWEFVEGFAVVENNKKRGYIDKTGKIVIDCQFDYAYDFYQGLAAVQKKEKYGYIDKNGKIVIDYQFDSAGEFISGIACVKNSNKYGYIDKTGTLISDWYDEGDPLEKGLAKVVKDNKYAFIDMKGKLVTIWYDNVDRFYSNKYLVVEKNNKKGVIDTTGAEVIKCEYDDINYASLSDFELIAVKKNKWGYINSSLMIVIPFKYDAAQAFSEGFAAVCQNDKWAVINEKDIKICDFIYAAVFPFEDGTADVFDDWDVKSSNFGYKIDCTGKKIPNSWVVKNDEVQNIGDRLNFSNYIGFC